MNVFDATRYTTPPPGLDNSLVMLYESEFFSGPDRSEVDYAKVEEVALANQTAALICIDIEVWKMLDTNTYNMHDSITKYREVLRTFKKFAPNPVLGLYGNPPRNDGVLSIAAKDSLEYRRWRSMCADMEVLGDYVDAVFPSCYGRYKSHAAQRDMVKEYVYAAHRYGIKRVIPFFMPYYTAVIDDPSVEGQMIDGNYTRNIMDVISVHTDEMVLWDFAANTAFVPGSWWPALLEYK